MKNYHVIAAALFLIGPPAEAQHGRVVREVIEDLSQHRGFSLHPRFLLGRTASPVLPFGTEAGHFESELPAPLVQSLPSSVHVCAVAADGMCNMAPGTRVVAITQPVSAGEGMLEVGASDIARLDDGSVSGKYFIYRFQRVEGRWKLVERVLHEGFTAG